MPDSFACVGQSHRVSQVRKVAPVFANFTITHDRKKKVDFSTPYFAFGTQFIAGRGVLKSSEQLDGLHVGADEGMTNGQQVRAKFPKATIVARLRWCFCNAVVYMVYSGAMRERVRVVACLALSDAWRVSGGTAWRRCPDDRALRNVGAVRSRQIISNVCTNHSCKGGLKRPAMSFLCIFANF